MTTELIPKKITPEELFVPKGLDVILAGVKVKVDKFNKSKFDLDKKKDQDKIRSFAHNVAKSKTFVHNAKVEYVRDKKAALKIIDTESKRFCDSMDEIKTTVRKPLTDWEDAEKARIEEEQRINQINIEHEEALQMHDLFKREEEMKKERLEIDIAMNKIREGEAEQKREKERIEREDKIREDAAAQAKRDADNQRLEAEQKLEEEKNRRIREAELAEEKRLADIKQAEKEKQDAIDKLKREQEIKEQAQRDWEESERKIAEKKKADQERYDAEQKAIEDARQADTKHRKKVNNNIMKCLAKFKIGKDDAKDLITAIVKNEIPGLVINY